MSTENGSLLSTFDIIISTPDNPICPANLLGVVLHQEYNSFARKTASVIVFENLQFADFLDVDIDASFNKTGYNTGDILKGIPLYNDGDVTNAIKSGVIKIVFETIRKNLKEAENETQPS